MIAGFDLDRLEKIRETGRPMKRLMLSLLTFLPVLVTAEPMALHLRDKTLVAWVKLANLTQHGGGALTLERSEGTFDSIVFGELEPGRWMAGSEVYKRSERQQTQWPAENATAQTLVQVAISYAGKTVRMFRNGVETAHYEMPEALEFAADTLALLGKRHRGGTGGFLLGEIEEARIYDHALDAASLAALQPNQDSSPSPVAQWTFEDGTATDLRGMFLKGELRDGARIEHGRLILEKEGAYLIAAPAAVPRLLPPPPYVSPIQFRPKRGNFADPIPFFHAGEYHVFYLRGAIGKVPWEHLVSKDLVNWQELPPALLSDGEENSMDGENMFTGSAVEHEGVQHIFYTGWNPRNPKNREFICHATSTDGVKWTKHPEDAFSADGVHYDHQRENDFRDAFVFWNEEQKQWWMLLCARAAGDKRPVTGVAVSKDLIKWEQREPLCDGYAGTPECPDLFRIGATWYLIVSPSEGVTTYRTAPSLNGPWSPAPGKPIDTPILYAAKRMFDGKRHVLTGWQRDLEGERNGGNFQWGGYQSIPREVYEVVPGELGFRPVPEVRSAFSKEVYRLPQPLTLDGSADSVGAKAGTQFTAPSNYRLDLHASLEGAETFTVGFRIEGGGYRLTLHSSPQEIGFTGPGMEFRRVCLFDPKLPVHVEAFVLGSLIEVFVNDRHAFSARAYDYPRGAIELAASGGKVSITDLVVQLPR